ncbi:MAG TPA: protein kinase [Sedimentisphaerales bacterium]|nr:protein kinase [Sedimentisphaerales bacterium]
MSTEPNNIEAIYSEAQKRIDKAARSAYLESVCAGDPALRARLESLLRAHDRAGQFLDTPPPFVGIPLPDETVAEGPGSVIGRYKLLEKIGEGGMAIVYMAEQEHPIRRKVALKIIKLGMDTRQVIARFEAERQALALMDHPSIAKVLDAGATETGRPYFVMELVQGVSITEYCDGNNLNTKDRLALFVQVCHAVQHAHQKGIIHRDIKPSNVMVTHHDGKPVPKVIDFGIAKATNQRLTEKTLFTRYAHLIGTPAYMSPEQAELSDLNIDTRTDIYSLGVLLYELLTGTTPFSEEELRKAGYVEMQRVIREQEPVKPSTRIRTAQVAQPPSAGKSEGSPPRAGVLQGRPGARSVYQQVRGDLDWIVMKTLEKDRSRRYDTAGGLAEDIRRHLEHEPVLARGPGVAYRVEKFLRRHRSQVLAAVALAVIAVAAVVILSMWNRDRARLAEAEGFKHRGILSQAREQYAKAEREAALATINPIRESKHVGPEARLLEATILVDNRQPKEAMAVLGGLLNEKPEVAGAAHSLLARILWESGSPDAQKLQEIEEHRKQAELMLPETAEAYFLRAMTAVTVKEQLVSLDKALQLDPRHYESRRLRAFTYHASRKYEKMKDDALAMTILRDRDPLGFSLRAIAWRELNRYQEAIADYDSALSLTPQADPQHIDLRIQRCEMLLRMEEFERVVRDAQACFALSPDKAVFQYDIFCGLTALGEYDAATVLFREIISQGNESRQKFRDWCAKYVFETLDARRLWHPADREPTGAAFLPMVEAEETYRSLSTKGRRLTTDGFSANWSPDGKKLAFSLGVHGYSGVAIFDPATKETELLIVPGKDPRWSPDGKHIAFVRDCQSLSIPELVISDRRKQSRTFMDEEIWVMRFDGTAPKRLACGGWPSWSQNSSRIYYKSCVDNAIYAIPIRGKDAKPEWIMASLDRFPSVSPDDRYVAYVDGASLKIENPALQGLMASWPTHCGSWCEAPSWSPRGDELCMGGGGVREDWDGLWVYRLHRTEPVKILKGRITAGSWAPDGTKLAFELNPPSCEIWTANLDPNRSVIESLGPGRTPGQHLQEMVAQWTGQIEADPNDPYAYFVRAEYYDSLHEQTKAIADMRRWSVLVGGLQPDSDAPAEHPGFIFGQVENLGSPINTSFDEFGPSISFDGREFYCSSYFEGWDIGTLRRARRQTVDDPWGETESFTWPLKRIFTSCISPDGLSLYVDSDQMPGDICVSRRAGIADPWGAPENLGPNVNSPAHDFAACISADGLELYFSSNRPGGFGDCDIWVSTRTTVSGPWGKAAHLGSGINSPAFDGHTYLTSDGLTLFLSSRRPGGYGDLDIWVTRRSTRDGHWGEPVNLGPAVNTAAGECEPCVSSDGRTLFFSDADVPRPGGYGGTDLWQVSIIPLADLTIDNKTKAHPVFAYF